MQKNSLSPTNDLQKLKDAIFNGIASGNQLILQVPALCTKGTNCPPNGRPVHCTIEHVEIPEMI